MRHISSTLRWRRTFGAECNICPYFMALDEEYKTLDKSAIAKMLKDKGALDRFKEKRAKHIQEKIDNFNKTGNGRAKPANKSDVNVKGYTVLVVVVVVVGYTDERLEYAQVLGNVWPVSTYQRVKGVKPPKRQIQTHEVAPGFKVKGVLENTNII